MNRLVAGRLQADCLPVGRGCSGAWTGLVDVWPPAQNVLIQVHRLRRFDRP